MERATVAVYDRHGAEWARRRRPVRAGDARAFAGAVPSGGRRVDLGCGAGRYLGDLGRPAIGLDASDGMLQLCRQAHPDIPLVRADLELLPFGPGVLAGAWANMSYLHVPRTRLPLALADLHRASAVGAVVDVQVLAGDYEGDRLPDDDVGGRFFAAWRPAELDDVCTGAGFEPLETVTQAEVVRIRALRRRTLADTVGPAMRVLFVGLNPSGYSADAGVGYARPGNRFWPALLAAGAVTRDRDAAAALADHGVGLTDIVKRATSSAAELTAAEYRRGMDRVERLTRWLGPRLVCFVGLTGWRLAVDRSAVAGRQPATLGGRPVYVMPSTSGVNAHARLDDLVGHVRAALELAARAA